MLDYFPGIWKSTSRGDGIVTAMVKWNPVKAADYNTVYPKGQPQLSLVARWLKVYDWRDSSQSLTDPTTWKWSENAVLGYVWYKLINEGERPTVPSVIAGVANSAWDTQLAAILTRKWAALFAPHGRSVDGGGGRRRPRRADHQSSAPSSSTTWCMGTARWSWPWSPACRRA
jgi:hypothetical protein